MMQRFREFRFQRLKEKFDRADAGRKLELALPMFRAGERSGRYVFVCMGGRVFTGGQIYFDTKEKKFYCVETFEGQITGLRATKVQEVAGPLRGWNLQGVDPKETARPDLFQRLLSATC